MGRSKRKRMTSRHRKNCKSKGKRLEAGNKESLDRVWNELKNIVATLISVNTTDINLKEINDLLMIISSNPDKLALFDNEYGSQNVELAIEKAKKICFTDGTIAENLSDFLWKKRYRLMHSLNISFVSKTTVGRAWRRIIAVSGFLHNSKNFHIPQYRRNEYQSQESKLSILMSVDPDILRSEQSSLEIGQSKSEIVISQCKHILEGITGKSKRKVKEVKKKYFREIRNKRILLHGRIHLKKEIANYDDIFKKVRVIVEKYWNEGCEQQLDALTVLFIVEPKLVHSKFLFTTIDNDECLATIEDEIRVSLKQSIDKTIDSNNTNVPVIIKDTKSIVDTGPVCPIISHLEPTLTIKKIKKLKSELRWKVKKEFHSKILEWDGKFIVCSNTEAFEWLKTEISEKNEKWKSEMSMTIVERQYVRVAMLSQLRLRKPISTYMDNIQEQYPNLHTKLWTYLETESDWMVYVGMDIDSIAELEQHKRCIQVNEHILKFTIFYTPKWVD